MSAQAVWGMMRTLTTDRTRATIAVIAAAVILLSGRPSCQLAAIALGGVLGFVFCRNAQTESSGHLRIPISRSVAVASFLVFFILLFSPSLFLVVRSNHAIAFFEAFYRSGALVFGGGHVVLPLLQAATVSTGWTDNNTFLAGYGAAQSPAGTVVFFRRLSRGCGATSAARSARRGHRTHRHFPSRPASRYRRASFPESITVEREEPRGLRGCECQCRRDSFGGSLSACVDECRPQASGFRGGADRIPSSHGMESAALDGGHRNGIYGRGVELPILRARVSIASRAFEPCENRTHENESWNRQEPPGRIFADSHASFPSGTGIAQVIELRKFATPICIPLPFF